MTERCYAVGFTADSTSFEEHVCPGCIAKGTVEAIRDMAHMEVVPSGVADEDLNDLVEVITRSIRDQVVAFGKIRGLTAQDMAALAMHTAHATQVTIVDSVLGDKHPLVRAAYLSTTQRLLTINSVLETLARSFDTPQDCQAELELFISYMDNPPSVETMNHVAKEHGHDDDGASHLDDNARQLMLNQAYEILKDKPDSVAKGLLVRRLKDLAAKYDLTVPGDDVPADAGVEPGDGAVHAGVVELKGEPTPEEIAQAIAAEMAKKGINVDPADLVASIKQAEEIGYSLQVLPRK